MSCTSGLTFKSPLLKEKSGKTANTGYPLAGLMVWLRWTHTTTRLWREFGLPTSYPADQHQHAA